MSTWRAVASSHARGATINGKVTPPAGTSVPKVTVEYSSETEAAEKQGAEIRGKIKTITRKGTCWGSGANTTRPKATSLSTPYEEGGDGRLEKIKEGKGKEAESK